MKHPVRRKIIGILNETPATYTELLNRLEVETGFLNYHLSFLDGLITKKNDARYVLSDFGRAAFELTNSIEAPIKRKSRTINFFNWNINPAYITIIFIAILFLSNVYLVYAYQSLSSEKTNTFKNTIFQSKTLLTKSINVFNFTINESQINLLNFEDLRKDLIKLSEKYILIMSLDVEHREQWVQMKESTDLLIKSLEDLDNKITAFLILEPNKKDIMNIYYSQLSCLGEIRDDLLKIKQYAFSDEITLSSSYVKNESEIMKAVEASIKLQIDINSFRRAFNIGERGFS
jgi:hypothetical protein